MSLDALIRQFGSTSSLVSGRLHILNLEKLQRHFGDRWPRVRERALSVAEQTIEAGLAPGDLQHRVGDAAWLMFFPKLDKATAQTRCALIAERIFKRLAGDDARFDDLDIRTVVVETDGTTMLESADPVALIQSALDAMVAEEDAEHHAEVAGAREPERFPEDIRFRFVPMLDLEHGAINTYGCQPWRVAGGGVELTGHGVLSTGDRSPLVQELDVRTLRAAVEAQAALLGKGKKAVLACDIHCRTIEAGDARREILKTLEAIPTVQRGLLAIGVAGLPEGAPAMRIGYAVSFLKRYCRAVTIVRPLQGARPERVDTSGAYGMNVWFDIAPRAERVVGPMMDDFVRGAAKHRLKGLAFGLLTASQVVRAMEAGFTYLSGDGLAAAQPEPEGVRMFDRDAFRRALDPHALMAAGRVVA